MGFDGDATLPLEIHVIEDLRLHVAGSNSVRQLEKPVGQCRLSMVDVGNDGKIADILLR